MSLRGKLKPRIKPRIGPKLEDNLSTAAELSKPGSVSITTVDGLQHVQITQKSSDIEFSKNEATEADVADASEDRTPTHVKIQSDDKEMNTVKSILGNGTLPGLKLDEKSQPNVQLSRSVEKSTTDCIEHEVKSPPLLDDVALSATKVTPVPKSPPPVAMEAEQKEDGSPVKNSQPITSPRNEISKPRASETKDYYAIAALDYLRRHDHVLGDSDIRRLLIGEKNMQEKDLKVSTCSSCNPQILENCLTALKAYNRSELIALIKKWGERQKVPASNASLLGKPLFKPSLGRQRAPTLTASTYGKMSQEVKEELAIKYGPNKKLDPSKLRMRDFIFFNPSDNKMTKPTTSAVDNQSSPVIVINSDSDDDEPQRGEKKGILPETDGSEQKMNISDFISSSSDLDVPDSTEEMSELSTQTLQAARQTLHAGVTHPNTDQLIVISSDSEQDEISEETKTSEGGSDNQATSCPSPVPVPQVRIGDEGQIILAPESLRMKKPESAALKANILQEFGFGDSNKKKKLAEKVSWSFEETLEFYQALQIHGTDFSCMEEALKNRTRRNIKTKFKREEKKNPALIDKVLSSQGKNFDLDDVKKELTTDKTLRKLCANIARPTRKRNNLAGPSTRISEPDNGGNENISDPSSLDGDDIEPSKKALKYTGLKKRGLGQPLPKKRKVETENKDLASVIHKRTFEDEPSDDDENDESVTTTSSDNFTIETDVDCGSFNVSRSVTVSFSEPGVPIDINETIEYKECGDLEGVHGKNTSEEVSTENASQTTTVNSSEPDVPVGINEIMEHKECDGLEGVFAMDTSEEEVSTENASQTTTVNSSEPDVPVGISEIIEHKECDDVEVFLAMNMNEEGASTDVNEIPDQVTMDSAPTKNSTINNAPPV